MVFCLENVYNDTVLAERSASFREDDNNTQQRVHAEAHAQGNAAQRLLTRLPTTAVIGLLFRLIKFLLFFSITY